MAPPSSCSSDTSHNIIKRAKSNVQLSLSLEGKAELISHNNSPEKFQSLRPLSALPSLPKIREPLQRSQSSLPSITLPPISTLTSSLPPRLSRGRSRNARAWESCADADNSDELTTQAENEVSGSALAAISLLRSTSGVLQPISGSKRNASVSRPQLSHEAKKAKLARTSSSFARLETLVADTLKDQGKPDERVKVSMLLSPTDSDKENWSPKHSNPYQQSPRRRPLPTNPSGIVANPQNPRRPGRVLQESGSISLLLNNRANTAPTGGRQSAKEDIEIFDDSNVPPPKKRAREDEVEKFMKGGVSPSKKGDMDCVAGLLSLSQGAWR